MKTLRTEMLRRAIVVFVASILSLVANPAMAQLAETANLYHYKALHNFCASADCSDGLSANGDLVRDSAGRLYGTTSQGGNPICGEGQGCGTVFQLSPTTDGNWKLTTIFKFDGADGANPAAGLAMDGAGNLYGTTTISNTSNNGSVFELSPARDGTWKFSTILKFNGNNGSNPEARLILDARGNLYGTTSQGGDPICGCGTVFELSPAANGQWKHRTLLRFSGENGASPYSAVVFDDSGNLYGTTSNGGVFGMGTVFRLSPRKDGIWHHATLFNFNGTDGGAPRGSLLIDAAGNIFGTTADGGEFNDGTVYELSRQANRDWKHTAIVAFDIKNGSFPTAGLISDSAGNLYGDANDGRFGIGIVFQLSPQADGTWKQTTLLTFNGVNGSEPAGGLFRDRARRLFGATVVGGKHNSGVVYELSR